MARQKRPPGTGAALNDGGRFDPEYRDGASFMDGKWQTVEEMKLAREQKRLNAAKRDNQMEPKKAEPKASLASSRITRSGTRNNDWKNSEEEQAGEDSNSANDSDNRATSRKRPIEGPSEPPSLKRQKTLGSSGTSHKDGITTTETTTKIRPAQRPQRLPQLPKRFMAPGIDTLFQTPSNEATTATQIPRDPQAEKFARAKERKRWLEREKADRLAQRARMDAGRIARRHEVQQSAGDRDHVEEPAAGSLPHAQAPAASKTTRRPQKKLTLLIPVDIWNTTVPRPSGIQDESELSRLRSIADCADRLARLKRAREDIDDDLARLIRQREYLDNNIDQAEYDLEIEQNALRKYQRIAASKLQRPEQAQQAHEYITGRTLACSDNASGLRPIRLGIPHIQRTQPTLSSAQHSVNQAERQQATRGVPLNLAPSLNLQPSTSSGLVPGSAPAIPAAPIFVQVAATDDDFQNIGTVHAGVGDDELAGGWSDTEVLDTGLESLQDLDVELIAITGDVVLDRQGYSKAEQRRRRYAYT